MTAIDNGVAAHGDSGRSAATQGSAHSAAGNTRPGAPATGSEVLALCDAATLLTRSLAAPVHRLTLRSGDCVVDLEFAPLPAPAVGDVPGTGHVGPRTPPSAGAPEALAEPASAPEGVAVRAPLVGTYYCAPAPGEPPFVRPGDQVTAGQTVAIVEAMKLMNPVIADVTGTVRDVLVSDGGSVEYDQPLLVIAPADAGAPAEADG